MSTHCMIALKEKDGSCHAIYCHFDGYIASAGRILAICYTKVDHIRELINQGHLSSLRQKLYVDGTDSDECILQDPIDGDSTPYIYSTEDEYWNDKKYADIRYLFKDDIWYVNREKLGVSCCTVI